MRSPRSQQARFLLLSRGLICPALGLLTTIAIALQSARASHIFIDSSPKLALARPAAAPATQLPDFICYTHERRFAAEMWELTYIAVPGYNVPPTATELPDDAPAWVGRRLRACLNCGPNNWPDFPPAPNGRVCHSVLDIERFGWPRPALWFSSRVQQPFTGSGPRPGWIAEGAVLVAGTNRAGTSLPLYLPTRPDWPGLIIDTLAWATPFALMFLAADRLRRTRRHRRGQCPACGYDLTDTPSGNPCPECGRTNC